MGVQKMFHEYSFLKHFLRAIRGSAFRFIASRRQAAPTITNSFFNDNSLFL